MHSISDRPYIYLYFQNNTEMNNRQLILYTTADLGKKLFLTHSKYKLIRLLT